MLNPRMHHKCLKMAWLARIYHSQGFWNKVLQKQFKHPLKQLLQGNLPYSLMKTFIPATILPFWKECLKAWCQLNYISQPHLLQVLEIYNQPLWYNANIIFNHLILTNEKLVKK